MKLSFWCINLLLVTNVSDAFVSPSKIASYSSSSVHDKQASVPQIPFYTTTKASSSITSSRLNASPTETIVGGVSLTQYFWQAVIDNGLPALFTIITLAAAAFFFKRARGSGDSDDYIENKNAIDELYNDLYGSTSSGNIKSPFGGFGGGRSGDGLNKDQKRNLGIPATEYIQVRNLNEKYASYDFSLKTAITSKAAAAADYRNQAFDRALQKALTPFGGSAAMAELPAHAKRALLSAEKEFLTEGRKIVGEIQELEAQLVKASLDMEIVRMGMQKPYDPKPVDGEDKEESGETKQADDKKKEANAKKMEKETRKITGKVTKELSKLQEELQELELEFIQEAVSAVGPERALGFREALLKDVAVRGAGGLLKQLERRPLSAFFQSDDGKAVAPKSLFVMNFPGDVTASQLNELREEVTAVIRNAKPGDEALLILQSGGGTVTGYGLAAGQLVRLKEKGIFLTIAVEQVAASGGYMMSCVADKIIASPFAVLGSIGVISEQPNVYERLKREGM